MPKLVSPKDKVTIPVMIRSSHNHMELVEWARSALPHESSVASFYREAARHYACHLGKSKRMPKRLHKEAGKA